MKTAEPRPVSRITRLLKSKLRSLMMTSARAGFALTSNDRALNNLKDKHRGQKAVIIGMGPSLKTEDLERLGSDVTTFACNKIFLIFDQTEWRPHYYSICDVLVAENNQELIARQDFGGALQLHASIVKPYLKPHRDYLYYRYFDSIERRGPLGITSLPGLLGGGILAGGYSILIDQLQIAFAMGFTEVYVIGVDFSFSLPQGGATGKSSSGEVIVSEGEVNHFHKDYRKPGETWTVPKMDQQRFAFDFMRKIYEADGRKLLNASRQTKLDVIERADLDLVFTS